MWQCCQMHSIIYQIAFNVILVRPKYNFTTSYSKWNNILYILIRSKDIDYCCYAFHNIVCATLILLPFHNFSFLSTWYLFAICFSLCAVDFNINAYLTIFVRTVQVNNTYAKANKVLYQAKFCGIGIQMLHIACLQRIHALMKNLILCAERKHVLHPK